MPNTTKRQPRPTARTAAAKAKRAGTPSTGGYAEHVVDLDRGHRDGAELFGGKGARLAEMIGAGLPVPPAFCITTPMFDLFLDQSGLAEKIRGAESGQVREWITAAALPDAFAQPILDAYARLGRPRVAVRSSARKEDSAARSFAGQHDTFLDVSGDEALLEAVKGCWASLWSERAAAYRDPTAAPGSIAVVVQQMVPADVSGVLFTVDPVGGQVGRMVVEACHGLGEGLVSGKVSSDFFALDDTRLDVLEERIRYKVTKCAPTGSGRITMTKVDPAARNAPCLSTDQLRTLGELAQRVRAQYDGSEQDIEWALHDGRFQLLQTRPITTRPATTTARSPYIKPQPEHIQHGALWTRMDIGEIFVGLMTPLGLSFARYHQTYVHAHCAAAVGVRDTGDYVGYMGYLQGHVYLNTSYTSYLLGQCLPTRDQRHFTDRFVSEEVDLSDYRNPYGKFPGGVQDVKSTTHWIKHTATEMLQMRQRARHMVDSRLREFDRARSLDLTRFTRAELHAELARYLDYYFDMHVGYMPYYINAFGAYGLMTELCAKWLGHAGDNLQNRIKTDMSSLRTVASAREIWAVAQGAKDRPRALAIIRDSPLEQIEERLLADEDGRAFWDRHMEPFLRANGVRSRQEMELTHPRWVDDPSYLFQMIRRYAEDGFSIDEILQRSRGYNENDATEVLDTLPKAKRVALKKIIALYTTCSELRETTRMAMVTSLWLIRNIVYEIGRRLLAQGLLHSLDEVAYLDFEDVRAYLRGEAEAEQLFAREKIDEARRMHEYYNRLPEPPLTFIGEYDPADRPRPASGSGPQLRGLGASPGRVVGRARIIEDLVWQADEFQPGEILITRYTDASWTPLFAIAGGVVTDIGSMLSHSSIVAREFNVPSVVNTKNATQNINTGDMVAVDGDTGIVEVVDEQAIEARGEEHTR